MRRFVLVSVFLLVAIPAAAQSPKPAPADGAHPWSATLASDGHPDLQGIWLSNSATPLERPPALEGRATLTDAEVADLRARADRIFKNGDLDSDFAGGDNFFLAALANVERFRNVNATGGSEDMIERWFEHRTSLIVDPPDGKIPWTPEGRQRQAAMGRARLATAADGPESLTNDARCLSFGMPRLGGNYGAGHYSYYQIVQTPGYVVMSMEYIHEARIIPLGGQPHLPPQITQWNGDSRGRWEGQTLVVETTNFARGSNFMGATGNLRLVERFTLVAADRVDYEVTLSDPTTWSRPWTVMIPLKRSDDRMFEVSCHEGNHDVMEGILRASRAREAEAEKVAQPR